MAKKGKLIGIGVGPGDTELLTLKAAKVLETVPVVFSPKSSKEKESIALSIVRPVLEKRKDYKRLMLVDDSGRDVAFITLGDSSIFSTYSYVQKKLIGRYEIETIPGITSFTACAAARNEALVEQNDILTIVPKIDDRLEEVLDYSDSIVLMKASRNTSKLENTIEEKNRPKEIYSVENCTRENEKIIEGFSNEKPYLTTTIIKFSDD